MRALERTLVDPFRVDPRFYSDVPRAPFRTWLDEIPQMGDSEIRILRGDQNRYYLVTQKGIYQFERDNHHQSHDHPWIVTWYRTGIELGLVEYPSIKISEVKGTFESFSINQDWLNQYILPKEAMKETNIVGFGIDEIFESLSQQSHFLRVIQLPFVRSIRWVKGEYRGGPILISTFLGGALVAMFGPIVTRQLPLFDLIPPRWVQYSGMTMLLGSSAVIVWAVLREHFSRKQTSSEHQQRLEGVHLGTSFLKAIQSLANEHQEFKDMEIGFMQFSSLSRLIFWDPQNPRLSKMDFKLEMEVGENRLNAVFSGNIKVSGEFIANDKLRIDTISVDMTDNDFIEIGLQETSTTHLFEILNVLFQENGIQLSPNIEIQINDPNLAGARVFHKTHAGL